MALLSNTDEGLTRAKLRLYQAAGEFDPAAPLRKRPYTTVTLAAIVGFVLGGQRGTAGKSVQAAKTANRWTALIAPIAGAAGRFVLNKLAQQQAAAAAAAQEAAHAAATSDAGAV